MDKIRFKIRLWMCKHLSWHHITQKWYSEDGLQAYGRCGICGFEGMIDSQGGLF